MKTAFASPWRRHSQVTFVMTLLLLICQPTFAQDLSKIEVNKDAPQFIYLHAGVGGNLFAVGSEDMKRTMEPFKLETIEICVEAILSLRIRNRLR